MDLSKLEGCLAVGLDEACAATRIPRSTMYRLLQTGELQARKVGRRTVILVSELERFLSETPVAPYGVGSCVVKKRAA